MTCFFDTNILVYLFDGDAPEKQVKARELLDDTRTKGGAILSTQVLQEFFVTTTRKLAVPLSHEEAERAVKDLAMLSVIQIDKILIFDAIQRHRSSRYSFWDSLIIQAALKGGASVLYSEDMQHLQKIDGLHITNPLIVL